MTESLRIVRLESENIKRLRAVEISPDGNIVVIGGRNGQGKSSVLDSIAYALGGKTEICDEPLRRGERRGHVVLDLGDLVVRRTFTKDGGGQLTVSNTEGATYKSPQAMLDKIVGHLAFDPLQFSRMSPNGQSETLRALVDLDTSEIDGTINETFDKRAEQSRTADQLEGHLADLTRHQGVGTEEVSIVGLIAERDRRATHNDGCAVLQGSLAEVLHTHEKRDHWIAKCRKDIERLRSELAGAESALEMARKTALEEETREKRIRLEIEAFVEEDVREIADQIEGAEERNAKARENHERAGVAKRWMEYADARDKLTDDLDALRANRRFAIEATEFPVEGLGFSENGVTFNELPFDQASSSEQLRVSVAIGLAMNPKLRVLLVRDGSLLDEDSMRLLAEMAAEAEAQVWVEVVRTGDGVSVVIEDGEVRGE